jgi:hypothetical protein
MREWARQYAANTATLCPDVAVTGNYMYRNAPFVSTYQNYATELPMYWVRPKMRGQPGSAIFKTTKLLGGRVVVSDDWTRVKYEQLNILPGYGVKVHREGYNALYGDWSVSWYGDPQRRLMYVECTGGSSGGAYQTHVHGFQNAAACGFPSSGYRYANYPGCTETGVERRGNTAGTASTRSTPSTTSTATAPPIPRTGPDGNREAHAMATHEMTSPMAGSGGAGRTLAVEPREHRVSTSRGDPGWI